MKYPRIWVAVHARDLEDIVRDPDTPADVLRVLAQESALPKEMPASAKWQIKALVGEHPNTPEDVIREVYADPRIHVKCSVAVNPNAPDDLLWDLMGIAVPEAREAAKETLQKRGLL